MLISEYLAAGYHVLTDTEATAYGDWMSVSIRDVVEKILDKRYGEKQLFTDTETAAVESEVQATVTTVLTARAWYFERLYKQFTHADYDPTTTSSFTDSSIDQHSGTDSNAATDSSTDTPGTVSTQSSRTFDDAAMTDVAKTATTGTDAHSGSNSGSVTYGHKLDHTADHLGRDGGTVSEIMQRDRAAIDWSYYDLLAQGIVSEIAFSVWYDPDW